MSDYPKTITVESQKDIPQGFTGTVYFGHNRTDYYLKGKLHNVNGPASVSYSPSVEIYAIEGRIFNHRNDFEQVAKNYKANLQEQRVFKNSGFKMDNFDGWYIGQ